MNISLPHTITYWAPDGNSTTQGTYGARAFAAPVVIAGRWQGGMGFSNKRAVTQSTPKALVITKTAVEDGGYLYKGKSTQADPTTLAGAYVIVESSNADTIDQSDNITQVMLGG